MKTFEELEREAYIKGDAMLASAYAYQDDLLYNEFKNKELTELVYDLRLELSAWRKKYFTKGNL